MVPVDDEVVYNIGPFMVCQRLYPVEGYATVKVWRARPVTDQRFLWLWVGMLRPRSWPWPVAELGFLFTVLVDEPQAMALRCLPYEQALKCAISYAEDLAAKDDVRFLREHVERKLLEVKLRQQAVDEIEAGLAPRQITDTSRESE